TVQGSWNYERMQGVGIGVAEEPLLRDLRAEVGDDGVAYRAAVARGAHFFNAHPYLCGLAVGAAARAEHDGVPPEQVERLRAALPLVAQYLSGALFGWARLALAGVVAGGFALLWWQRRRLTGLRLGLALLAVAALAGWLWP